MNATLGVARYELAMGLKRWGVWVAMALAGLPVAINWLSYRENLGVYSVWSAAGTIALLLNMLMPVIGGIAMSDRLSRDGRLNVAELLRATPLSRRAYVLGKYLGAVGAVALPSLVVSLVTAGVFVVDSGAPPTLLAAQAVAFVGVNLPAYLFVGAFSIAVPSLLPLRVYQVLFTGFWFWGNFPIPRLFPTIAGSLLSSNGLYAATGIFAVGGVMPWGMHTPAKQPWGMHTAEEAVANIACLLVAAAVALVALDRHLDLQEARA